MSCESICTRWSSIIRPSDTGPKEDDSLVVRLEPSQANVLATVLTRALYDEPQFLYLIPDEQARLRVLANFFRSAIRDSQQNGETFTTREVDGGALWLRPGNGALLASVLRRGFESLPVQWRWETLTRCMKLGTCVDQVHQRLIREPHWYLLAFGVEPSRQAERLRRALMERLLVRADLERLPCYLETFNEEMLPFYGRLGFRIEAGGRIPEGGPDFWAMVRTPKG
jgi:GNAT superfamily N-acetyltransferase